MKKFFGLLLAAVMTFSLVACGAQNVPSDNTSDDYPSGPITCIVPYAAGGGSDVLTRTIMKYISLPNNVNMVAVNVEGASGYTGCLQPRNRIRTATLSLRTTPWTWWASR